MKNNFKPAIRFEGFTEKWKLRKISDVVDKLYNGQTPSRAQKKFWNGEINWLTSGELNRSVVTKTIEKITTSGQESANLRIVPKGTFVMAITGLEAVGTRGNCAILGIETTLNQSCMAIFPKSDLLNTEFLFQWYKMVGENYGIQFTQGTKQQSYNAEIIKKLDICLPIVEEQTKIGDLFRQLEELISIHQQELDTLKQTKQGFLQKMFPKEGESVPELRFPGFTEDWEASNLIDMTTLITKGTTPKDKYSKSNVNFIKVENIEAYSGAISVTSKVSQEEHEGYLKRSQLKCGDILFSIAGTLGRTAVIKEEILPANTNQALAIIRLANGNIDFIETYLKGKAVKDYIRKNPTVGAQPNLSLRQVGELSISYPSDLEQKKIGVFFKNLDRTIALQQQEFDALKQTKKAFLQKMFV